MAATSWSWSSSLSCTSSFGSLDDDAVCVLKPNGVGAAAAEGGSIKFLCSYGGRILPRHTDGALRYVGGDNRVLSVDRPLRFHELQRKLRDMCGWEEVSLRCQLPTEDLDALVSVTSDDDLANLLEEYDAAIISKEGPLLQPLKIRAFLFPIRAPSSLQPCRSSPSTPASSVSRPSTSNAHFRRQNTFPLAAAAARLPSPTMCAPRWWAGSRPAGGHQPRRYDGRDSHGEAWPVRYLVHNGSHWQ
ncbi:hypothetical protein HU200_039300 [Digitaria exilis]|uniref:PB1 domain-containing protein n=1 Tax=Digitaria exilis TaxID=1010633 RepID=A0A835BBE8_9POAL|nr:hypothetical protein HU200_039300 [Digitaria exilis]CAB3447330.1 unnamed protein product [Digitaria exilis]